MRHKTLLAVLTAAVVAVACGSGGEDSASSGGQTTGNDTEQDKPAAVATVGQPARDGKFEFTVQKVECGVDTVGDSTYGEKAQGQFCLVSVKVKNIGDQAQLLSDSDQKAYDAKDTQYSTDSAAALQANKNADVFLNEINPGNNVTGVLVFSVPKKVKLTRLELHDSFMSGGITVKL